VAASEIAVIELLAEQSVVDIDGDHFKRLVSLESRAERIAYISFMREGFDFAGYDGMSFQQLRAFVSPMDKVSKEATLRSLESEWRMRKDPGRQHRLKSSAGITDEEEWVSAVATPTKARRHSKMCLAYLTITPLFIVGFILLLQFLSSRRSAALTAAHNTSSTSASVAATATTAERSIWTMAGGVPLFDDIDANATTTKTDVADVVPTMTKAIAKRNTDVALSMWVPDEELLFGYKPVRHSAAEEMPAEHFDSKIEESATGRAGIRKAASMVVMEREKEKETVPEVKSKHLHSIDVSPIYRLAGEMVTEREGEKEKEMVPEAKSRYLHSTDVSPLYRLAGEKVTEKEKKKEKMSEVKPKLLHSVDVSPLFRAAGEMEMEKERVLEVKPKVLHSIDVSPLFSTSGEMETEKQEEKVPEVKPKLHRSADASPLFRASGGMVKSVRKKK
jgi:hypothetical protein